MTTTPQGAVERLIERLRSQVDSGRRTLGGGSISYDGKCEMWGNEPIMVARNPDGNDAATLIESLSSQLAEARGALEYYADEARWQMNSAGITPAQDDRGHRARAALSLSSLLGWACLLW